MDELVKLLHQILDLLPWRQESDAVAAHEQAEALKSQETAAEPVGRNVTSPGVVSGTLGTPGTEAPSDGGTGTTGTED